MTKSAVIAPKGASASGASSEIATTGVRQGAGPLPTPIPTASPNGSDPVLDLIERAARDPSVDVSKIQALLDMREKQLDRVAHEDANTAMCLAQAEMGPVRKDAENPATRSMFATFEALDRALRPIYVKHGFSLSWDEEDCPKPDHLRVVCYLARGRFTRKYHRDMPIVTTGLKGQSNMTLTHANASANTYGKRYIEAGIFNITFTERDDDGNAAGGNSEFVDTGEVISAEQVANIKRMLKFKNRPPEEFMRWVRNAQPGAQTIEDIGPAYYESCVRAISQIQVKK